MAQPYIGEIQAFAFGYCPEGWLPCYGQTLSIQQYTPLFALIGTAYGGNGSSTFMLPNLVGRVAISQGQGPGLSPYQVGDQPGEAGVALQIDQMPWHTHSLQLGSKGSANATAAPAAGSSIAVDPNFNGFLPPPADTTFAPGAMGLSGNSEPHPNIQPTLAMIYCIATQGEFPSFG
ncbi:microcystin-dependent protein [Rhodopseudomonas rhenobacensis]|uniref:Microcystin-dependent protein n=1 Tax=Rhodopseudomonas rhenobacensis TaxID=87461 RepID=A0A7W7Z7K7_9BRAD|nr:tail fiber protein [Rhodopseudomonas rhenobacensis]MBB5048942.1 microcystin-dependent protein [Rhodopseudomonas rhenobacensis]